jgi:myo-inositol-1(or 4)-monophosphatase
MDEFDRVAEEAVREAGRRLRSAWGEAKQITYKGVIDLVTQTDREVEQLVVSRLEEAFPEHRIVAEEASSGSEIRRPADSEYVWYIDPLDGTTNFAHSYPHFAVSVALARGSETLLGIVHDPIRQETFRGRKGQGATLNGRAIAVSPTADLAQALLGTGFPYDRRDYAGFYLGLFEAFLMRSHGVRRVGAAALDLCHVACGRLDGFWEWKLKPWDTAAGTLIVREAGGHVSDLQGGPFDVFGQQTLASNGDIHAAMAEVLRQCLPEPLPWNL